MAIAQFPVKPIDTCAAIEKQLLCGFAAAIGVERPPVESLWSLYNHVIIICSGCHKKKLEVLLDIE